MKLIIEFQNIDVTLIVKKYQQNKQEQYENSDRFGNLKKRIFDAGIAVAEFAVKELLARKPEIIEQAIENIIKIFLANNGLSITLNKITLLTDETEGNLTGAIADIASIDYQQVLIALKPMFAEKITETDEGRTLLKVLNVIDSEDDVILKNILSAIDDDKKEEILQIFVTEYNIVICDRINMFAKKNELAVSVNKISIER